MHSNLFDDLLNKEFTYYGRGPDKYDCIGLAMEVARRLEVEIPAFTSYDKEDAIHKAILSGKELLSESKTPVNYSIVALQIIPKFVTHVGFVLEYPYFIHILEHSKVTIERLDSIKWKNRIRGFYK